MKEIWKEIEGFEGLYEISTQGRVRNIITGLIKKGSDNGHGYLCYGLYKNGKRKSKYGHRLVAQAFIPNPEKLKEINHIDENRKNNNLDNLEWISRKGNCNYGSRNLKVSKALKGRKQSLEVIKKKIKNQNRPIYAIYPDGTDEYYESTKICSEVLNLSRSGINGVIMGRHKTCGGLVFEHA